MGAESQFLDAIRPAAVERARRAEPPADPSAFPARFDSYLDRARRERLEPSSEDDGVNQDDDRTAPADDPPSEAESKGGPGGASKPLLTPASVVVLTPESPAGPHAGDTAPTQPAVSSQVAPEAAPSYSGEPKRARVGPSTSIIDVAKVPVAPLPAARPFVVVRSDSGRWAGAQNSPTTDRSRDASPKATDRSSAGPDSRAEPAAAEGAHRRLAAGAQESDPSGPSTTRATPVIRPAPASVIAGVPSSGDSQSAGAIVEHVTAGVETIFGRKIKASIEDRRRGDAQDVPPGGQRGSTSASSTEVADPSRGRAAARATTSELIAGLGKTAADSKSPGVLLQGDAVDTRDSGGTNRSAETTRASSPLSDSLTGSLRAGTLGGGSGASTARSPQAFGAVLTAALERSDETAVSARVVHASGSAGRQQVMLQLDPPELGQVRVHLRMDPSGVTLQVQAERASAARLFESRFADLRDALAGHGIKVDRAEVVVRTPAGAPTGTDHQEGSPFETGHGRQQAGGFGGGPPSGGRDAGDDVGAPQGNTPDAEEGREVLAGVGEVAAAPRAQWMDSLNVFA